MNIIRKNIFLLLTVFTVLIAIMPLFNQGLFPMHDDEQVGRLFELNYNLESLHIPPRISQNLGFGYGYPFFNFYPSFIYYVAEIFVLLGFSYIVSIKIMIAIGFILAAVFMYLFSKQYIGELGALVAAVLYTYAPYHSVDVYVRGALPEFFSFVFIPAIFWVMHRLSKEASIGNIIMLGIFGACLMLTHNLVMLMTIPFAFAYFLLTIYKNKNWKNYFSSLLLGGVIALLVSAYFWIPAILENKYTMVNLLTKELADYKLHFVSAPQFLHSPWGYGGSILGPMDGMSLEIGKIHLTLVAIVILVYFISFIRKKIKNSGVLILFTFLFILSVFLQSYYSQFIWDNLKALSYIQFPWRFMLFAVFTSSFVGGYLFLFRFDQRLKYILAVIIISACLIFYGQNFQPSSYLNVSDGYYTNLGVIRWKTSAMAFEYVPAGIATKKSQLNTTIVDITEEQIAKGIARPLDPGITINTLEDRPQYKKFEYSAVEDGKIQVNTFTFPGWETYLNGNEIGYNDMNKLRLITVDVPRGKGIVELKLTDTNIRKIANILSGIGIILVLILLPFYNRKLKYEKIK